MAGSDCYGRNGHEDAAGDAALLAKAVGRPVRVQWSRSDEHGWDPKGPPTLIDLRAGMDSSGNVTAWESEFFVPRSSSPYRIAGSSDARRTAGGPAHGVRPGRSQLGDPLHSPM